MTQKHFKLIGCNVLRREIFTCATRSPNMVEVVLLPQGLHDQPDILRRNVQKLIDTPPPKPQNPARASAGTTANRPYDAILLGYALCSNGTAGLTARECPLVIPRAHDCVSLLLGSHARYQEYFDRHPGSYWFSSGWIETCPMPGKARFTEELQAYTQKYGADNAEHLLRLEAGWLNKYNQAVYIDWNFPRAAEEKNFTRQCARELGWDYDELPGDSGMLQRLLDGDWNEDEFLVVPPGRGTAADPAGTGLLTLA